MKLSVDKRRNRWSDDAAFYSYRWLAWALAGLALTIPGRVSTSLPLQAGLLLLLGVITVAATAMAQGYVRLARQRPVVMGLDVLAGLLVVWLSGGGTLPFLPYALGALVLPALLFGWRGALIAGVAFGALDSAALLLAALFGAADVATAPLALRAVAPLAFAGAWVLLDRMLAHREPPSAPADPPPAAPLSRQPPSGTAPERLVRLSGFTDLSQGSGGSPPRASQQQGSSAQMQSSSRSDAARHAIFDLTPGESLSFSAALDQLRVSFSRQESVEVQLVTLGNAQPLHGTQHSVLLRVAQEALMNIYQHAHARSVTMTIAYEPQTVILSVQDDGVGLLDGTYERPGMHALRAVRYRLAELDGQLAVFEGENGGVMVRATLPLG